MKRGNRRSLRDMMIGAAWAALCALTPRPALAADGNAASGAACTQNEVWKFAGDVPKYYAGQFSKGFGQKTLFQTMLLADLLKDTSRAPDVRYLGEYFLYRSLYEMRLVHLAHAGFVSLVMRPRLPGTEGVQAAALSCLNRMHRDYASLFPVGVTIAQLEQYGPTPAAREAASSLAKLRLAVPQPSAGAAAGMSDELKFLESDGTREAMLKILAASDQGQEKDLIRGVIQLFQNYNHAQAFSTDPDRIYLLLGQAFYDIGSYERAIRSFRRVRNTSNYFVDALNDLAWAYLQRNDYSNAIAVSQNMIRGGLRDVYTPEANLVVAIALNETCNFAEAIESIKYFKRSYGKVNKWLSDWRARQLASPGNLYRDVAAYLKDRDPSVPDRIGTEWLRSPVFIASQDELNLLEDERPATRRLAGRVAKAFASKRDPRWLRVRRDLQDIFTQGLARDGQREEFLVANVNADLVGRTNRMISTLSEVSQNMQLVEAEIYNSISERMISEYAAAKRDRSPASDSRIGSGKGGVAVWDWGKLDGDSDAEVWDDEIGFLKTDIQSKCQKR